MPEQTRHDICLHLDNRAGSVEHYYHYCFGFLIPLVNAHHRLHRRNEVRNIYVRSCALMDTHTRSLNLEKLVIQTKEEHLKLRSAKTTGDGTSLQHLVVRGFDKPNQYKYGALLAARKRILTRLGPQIARQRDQLAALFNGSGRNILAVNRDKPPEYYLSAESEHSGYGTDRRSLPNFGEITEAIEEAYGKVASVRLDNTTLAEQIALFQIADIVVAQHGAALSNLLWCRSSTALVEIYPDMQEPAKRMHFERLAQGLRLRYREVPQVAHHAEVAPHSVIEGIADVPRVSVTSAVLNKVRWDLLFCRHSLLQWRNRLTNKGQPGPTPTL